MILAFLHLQTLSILYPSNFDEDLSPLCLAHALWNTLTQILMLLLVLHRDSLTIEYGVVGGSSRNLC